MIKIMIKAVFSWETIRRLITIRILKRARRK